MKSFIFIVAYCYLGCGILQAQTTAFSVEVAAGVADFDAATQYLDADIARSIHLAIGYTFQPYHSLWFGLDYLTVGIPVVPGPDSGVSDDFSTHVYSVTFGYRFSALPKTKLHPFLQPNIVLLPTRD